MAFLNFRDFHLGFYTLEQCITSGYVSALVTVVTRVSQQTDYYILSDNQSGTVSISANNKGHCVQMVGYTSLNKEKYFSAESSENIDNQSILSFKEPLRNLNAVDYYLSFLH